MNHKKTLQNNIKKPLTILIPVLFLIIIIFVIQQLGVVSTGKSFQNYIIKDYTTKQNVSIVGQPIKWIKTINKFSINDTKHYIEISKNSTNLKVSILDSKSVKSEIKASEIPLKLTNVDRVKLSEFSTKASKSEASLALAKSLKNKKPSFFLKGLLSFFKKGFSVFASVLDSVEPEESKPIEPTSNIEAEIGGQGNGTEIVSTSTLPESTGRISTSTNWTSILPADFCFNKNLVLSESDSDVKILQMFLNENGSIVAQSGAGSYGEETDYFGNKTKEALINFQETYSDSILKPLGLIQGTGYFGNSTRKKANEILGCETVQETVVIKTLKGISTTTREVFKKTENKKVNNSAQTNITKQQNATITSTQETSNLSFIQRIINRVIQIYKNII